MHSLSCRRKPLAGSDVDVRQWRQQHEQHAGFSHGAAIAFRYMVVLTARPAPRPDRVRAASRHRRSAAATAPPLGRRSGCHIVRERRKHGCKGLSSAGLHLGDRSSRQRKTAQQLDIVEVDLQHPTCSFDDKGKRLNDGSSSVVKLPTATRPPRFEARCVTAASGICRSAKDASRTRSMSDRSDRSAWRAFGQIERNAELRIEGLFMIDRMAKVLGSGFAEEGGRQAICVPMEEFNLLPLQERAGRPVESRETQRILDLRLRKSGLFH